MRALACSGLKKMYCPRCGTPLVIDTWGGWKWTCFHCFYEGEIATYEEVEKDERTGFIQRDRGVQPGP